MATCRLAQESQNFAARFTGTTCTLRIYASQQAYTEDGEQITGAQVGGLFWYKEYECTITDDLITIPMVELPSTTDAYPPTLTFTAIFYDENGVRQNTKLSGFFLSPELLTANEDTIIESSITVTAAGTSAANGQYDYSGQYNLKGYWNLAGQADSTANYAIRWNGSQWQITSAAGAVYYYSDDDVEYPWGVTTWVASTGNPPLPAVTQEGEILSTTWSAVFLTNNPPCGNGWSIDALTAWIVNYLNNVTVPWASTTIGGKVYTSVDPPVSYRPTVVATNDPMWLALDSVRPLRDWAGDLEAAIDELGAAVTTLMISEEDEYVATGTLIDSGLLEVGKAYEIVTYPGETTYVEIGAGGMGYTNGETAIPCAGGSGTGLTVDCTGVENGAQGILAGISINDGGSGYEVNDIVEVVQDMRNTVVVAGAGTGAADGIYTFRGTSGSKCYYNLTGQANSTTNYAVVWDGNSWNITSDVGGIYYTSTEDVSFPWEVTTWVAGIAIAPVPDVTQANMVVVAGAGTGAIDGFYTYRGTSGGLSYYNLFGEADSTTLYAIVFFAGAQEWRILDAAGDVAYWSDNVVDEPWMVTTWQLDVGAAPAPTVDQSTPCRLLINTVTGDDFENVGALWYGYPSGFANQAGTVFVATGTTPTLWVNQSQLRPCLTVPENITLQFWNGGTLRAEGDGGIYISSMVNPGQVQIFTSDGSGKIFVQPNAVETYNLAWWAGRGTGVDDTHEFKQARGSMGIGLVGGILHIPQGDWFTTEIKWSNFSTIMGTGSALDGIFATNIYPADLNAEFQGVFSVQQLFQDVKFSHLFISSDTSLTVSAFRFIAVRSTSQNLVFERIRFEAVADAGAEYCTIFKGETSFEEFVNVNFYHCSWTCWDDTGCLFWESTNSVSLWVNAQFRTRLNSNGVYFKYGGYHTFLQPEFRGVAAYTNTLELDRTITAACDTVATNDTINLNVDETEGNYLTREDLGRMITVPGVTFDGEDDTYITSILTPWQFTVHAAPDQTVNNQNISLYDVSDMPISNACIVADTHIMINVIGSSDEGYNYYFRDNAADYMNTFNLYGSLLQSKVLFEGGSSTFNSYGNTYYSGTFNATTHDAVVKFMGDTIQTYLIPRYQDRYPFPNIRALLTAEAWHLVPNNIYTITDYSTKQGDDQKLLYNVINQPAKFVQHDVFGGAAYTDPWVQILNTQFAGSGQDQRLLRLGNAWKTSDIARYYYDFYRDSDTGYLVIEGNQGGIFNGVRSDGQILADKTITLNTDSADYSYTYDHGGSVTQLTSKTTDVTINAKCGFIVTYATGTIPANDSIRFKVINSSVHEWDVPICVVTNNTGNGIIAVAEDVATGEFYIKLVNYTTSAETDTVFTIRFSLAMRANPFG